MAGFAVVAGAGVGLDVVAGAGALDVVVAGAGAGAAEVVIGAGADGVDVLLQPLKSRTITKEQDKIVKISLFNLILLISNTNLNMLILCSKR